MRGIKRYYLLVILVLLLTGCMGIGEDKQFSKTKITIEPYLLSENENQLISKTDVGHIEYFRLNGPLAEADDLEISVEVYEKGQFKEIALTTWGAVENKYKNAIISFGTSNFIDEGEPFKLISGIPSGLMTANYPHQMTASSLSNLLSEKITLEKDKPVYLVAWIGATNNELRAIGSENGELPEGIEEAELAFLYKVLWTDQKED